MTNQRSQPGNSRKPAAEIRLPILLFSSVLSGVLLALWITASFSTDAADRKPERLDSMPGNQSMTASPGTPTLCAVADSNQPGC